MKSDESSLVKMTLAVASGKSAGSFEKCQACGKYDWSNLHQCAPVFYAMPEDYGSFADAKLIHAASAAEAAEEFAEYYCMRTAEYSDMAVLVTDAAREKRWRFEVTIESVPVFNASQTSCEDMPAEEDAEI